MFAFAERQAKVKERNQKERGMPVCLCLCTFIKIRNGIKNLDLVSCTAVFIDLGKMSITILDKWLIGKLRKSFGEMNYT